MTVAQSIDREDYLSLDLYEEVVGVIENIETNQRYLILHLSVGSLRYPLDSEEACLIRSAADESAGSKIRILKTPASVHSVGLAVSLESV